MIGTRSSRRSNRYRSYKIQCAGVKTFLDTLEGCLDCLRSCFRGRLHRRRQPSDIPHHIRSSMCYRGTSGIQPYTHYQHIHSYHLDQQSTVTLRTHTFQYSLFGCMRSQRSYCYMDQYKFDKSNRTHNTHQNCYIHLYSFRGKVRILRHDLRSIRKRIVKDSSHHDLQCLYQSFLLISKLKC